MNQMNAKSQALTGKNNERINKTTKTDNENTAAWANTDHTVPGSHVSIPGTGKDTYAVRNAKEWVDNGSRL